MSASLKFPSRFVADSFVKYITSDELKGIIGSLGHTISQKYEGQELFIICNLKGGVVFLSDIVREIKNVKLYIDFVHVESIGRSKENSGTIVLNKDISQDLRGKNVLIVEEIIDTGRVLHFLKKRIELAAPSQIEVLTLFDKPYKRAVTLQANYIGKKIDDQFIIGYGMDVEEYGRNLEEVFFLKYPN